MAMLRIAHNGKPPTEARATRQAGKSVLTADERASTQAWMRSWYEFLLDFVWRPTGVPV
jgi:hypothetical protein